jgi:Protein of unknown function (DUF2397)/SbcC/RAD50-like, Walker B motif
MRALQDWKVVIRWQDKAKTEADFIRTRDRYQLTSEAADLHRWLRRKIDEDAVSTSAAAFAPAIIAERLDETIDAIGQRDLAQAAQAWAQVRTTLKDMADAASIWQSRMASALAGTPDAHKMGRLRETLIAYVTVWGAGVDTYSPRIRDALNRLRRIIADDDWRAMALSGVDATAAEETVRAIAQGNRDAADTLSVWFGERTGQALRLRRQVRDAVTPLLRGSRALLATGGRVTRRAELLRLASAIEAAGSDADAWKRWCAATGLWSARHVSGVPDELHLEYRTPRSESGDRPGGGWRSLERGDHGLLSGGAKVVTLMQPFIAALHAMYDQAGSGPRMLWLDEAFGGVDGTNRASMFRLLTSCDLDWLIAGPGIIANSAAVPMAAIYEVRRAPQPLPGVSLELTVWAGNELTHVMTPDPADLKDMAAPETVDEGNDALF